MRDQRDGKEGVGIDQGSITNGLSLSLRVSPVSARLSLAIAQMSPAMQAVLGRWSLPSGEDSAPMRSSSSWSGWPAADSWNWEKCPDTCTVASGRTVPENTRTRLIRPTYGSEVVLTTSASRGPAGSQDRPVTVLPAIV